jgi:hypothetical protein
METAYHPDFGQHVRYTFESMPEDAEGQVSAAMDKVCNYIDEDSKSPIIHEDALRRLEEGAGDPIAGVWPHIKRHLRFRQDVDIARDLGTDDPRKDDIVEVFIRPVDQSLLIQLRGMGLEDCDGYTMYGACLLTALGVPCTLVTVAGDAAEPNRFSHVYVCAYLNGRRIALDFSHGPYPGWEAPTTRIKEWPIRASNPRGTFLVLAAVAAYVAFRCFQKRRNLL